MSAVVRGRDAELALLSEFVAKPAAGACSLVLQGEAGMGKTTLFDACLAEARELDLRVLVARPAESENELSFAGLGDLLAEQLAEVLESLPPAQQRALSRALVIEDDEDAPADPRAVGVAVQSALRALAHSRTTLVAVDDVQWLDEASASALAFACRRLDDERVGVLLARRSGISSSLVEDLRRSLPAERLETVDVGPLDVVALHRLVQDRLGTILPRPLLVEVCEASGGNPFFAVEIVRTLQRRGTTIEAGQPLPVPDSLHELLDERLGALPDECRDFLLAAAAHAHPTIAITEAATQVDAAAGIDPALEAGIVELDGSRIRFTHPLLAACAYEIADPRRRTAIHVRLAEILEDPEARAWQLAAATSEPDEQVASALEAAAHHARARGAVRPAALLVDRAFELTPPDLSEGRLRRVVDAASLHLEAGDSRRAQEQLRAVVTPMPAGPDRARALLVLARIRLYERPAEARELFLQVVEEAGDDLRTLATAHEGVAACSVWEFERFEEALRHTDIALDLARRLGDEALVGDVLMTRLTAETLLGHPSAERTAEEALALQGVSADARVLDQPLIGVAERWIWLDEHARVREVLDEVLRHAGDVGDENGRPWLLVLLGQAALAQGDLGQALTCALQAQEAAAQSAQPLFAGLGVALESMVRARQGDADHVRTLATGVIDSSSLGSARLQSAAALGQLALALHAPDTTITHLEPCTDFVRAERMVEPGATRFVSDHVEALVELGRTQDARELLDWYEGNARRLGRTSVLANCSRCRGLLAGQAGDLDGAIAAFDEALELHAQVNLPLDHGCTLLALGVAQRRAKRRREARATLEEALAVFEEIGAALWAERARAELKRISGRAATPGALTPAEERVAAVVAEGKTNKEVAAALFLSDRTVEGHLARIFGKLGIRHRSELAGALQTRVIAVPNTGDSPVSAGPAAP